MSVAEKIKLSPENADEFLHENFDPTTFVSTMTRKQFLDNTARYDACVARGGTEAELQEIVAEIPIRPAYFIHLLVTPFMGPEFVKDLNLADVEKAFGRDFLERIEVVHDDSSPL